MKAWTAAGEKFRFQPIGKFRKLCLLGTVWALFCPWLASHGGPAVVDLRYLFVVNSSEAMASSRDAIAEAVSARIASGWNGAMRAGELFSVWTYQNSVSTDRYLPMAWSPSTAELLGERVARSLRNQLFAGPARMDQVIGALARPVLFSDELDILLLSDSTDLIQGTPFDEKINATYRVEQAKARGQHALLLTTLAARGGRLVGWSVEPLSVFAPSRPALIWSRERSLESSPPSVAAKELGKPPEPKKPASNAVAQVVNPPPARASDPPKPTPDPVVAVNAIPAVSANNLPASAWLAGTDDDAWASLPPASEPTLRDPARPAVAVQSARAAEPLADQPQIGSPRAASPQRPLEAAPRVAGGQSETKDQATVMTSAQPAPAPPPSEAAVVHTNSIKSAGPVRRHPVPAEDEREPNDSRRYLILGIGLAGLAIAFLGYVFWSRRPAEPSSLISRSLEAGRNRLD